MALLGSCRIPADELKRWIETFLNAREQNQLIFDWCSSTEVLGIGKWYSVSVSWFANDHYLYLMKDIAEFRTALSAKR